MPQNQRETKLFVAAAPDCGATFGAASQFNKISYHAGSIYACLPETMKIHAERQVTVALENQPGQLATICHILSENAVNIEAVSVIDNLEQSVVRLITSDATQCKQVLQAKGFYVIEGDVLVLDLFDRIGKLAEICSELAEAKINVDYVYGSVEHAGSPLRLVLRTTDIVRTHALLNRLRD
jgi:hypothetical protein